MSGGFTTILRRDLLLAMRRRGELANPLVFFLIVLTLVPLAVSPSPEQLAKIAPGIIWIMALLATLLSIDGLFQSDYRDGSLEQMIISPQPLWLIVLAKVLAHWLVTGLPLTLLSPLLGIMLSLPEAGYWPMVISLLVGTAALSLIGAIGAALTVALRRGGLLLSLVVTPLYMPVLVFGAGSVQRAVDGFSPDGPLLVVGALMALSLLLAPFACSGALKISMHG
ncbi:heme exporter protein CcmB [Porticoccus sp. W117]|uniref:heme exporter protein CcmB n=1 Tax=Porticoccus sp. W117 TaxID=3054777 RepID=UPI00259869BB|nr:heme exporter protein CcmB [Porticoccus sp. W117]MDM3869782.1 heme exporter protein CcmB [Porticoccus sp. W117]